MLSHQKLLEKTLKVTPEVGIFGVCVTKRMLKRMQMHPYFCCFMLVVLRPTSPDAGYSHTS